MATNSDPGPGSTGTRELAVEARSGLDPFGRADLPSPPNPKGFQWIGVLGPGVIVLGAAIGSGEYLLGPALFVKYGFVLAWVMLASLIFQTIFNQEVMRYTLYTGEPVISGFMRTKPKSGFWATVYGVLWFLQQGWPGWAAAAAGAIFFLFTGSVAGDGPADTNTLFWIAVGCYALCVLIVLFGRRIERTLEVLNWILVTVIIGGFIIMVAFFTSPSTWGSAMAGYVGYDTVTNQWNPIPSGVDLFLLGAVAAYAGAGGFTNIVLSNWARDKGYGMGSISGYIPAAVGGQRVELSHTGTVFAPTMQNLSRWGGWWRLVRADQWGIFFIGALLGTWLPGILYVEYIPRGKNLEDLGVAAALSDALGTAVGPALAIVIGIFAAWILFKTQLDVLEGFVRGFTDMVWSGSRRIRAAAKGDVRKVYYSLFAVIVLFGLIALQIPAPLVLLALGANWAGVVFVVSALHLLHINTKYLPKELQPPMWRKVALVAMSLFYFCFVWLFLFGGVIPDPGSDTAFVFNLSEYFATE